MRGNQPPGQMQFYRRHERLPGYNGNILSKGLTTKCLTTNDDLLIEGLYHAYKRAANPNLIHKNDLNAN